MKTLTTCPLASILTYTLPLADPARSAWVSSGGGNPRREQALAALAEKRLLAYMVGGPWKSPLLNQISRGLNVPEDQTAALYRQTKIVINIFRQQHHYNHQKLAATSLNPRIYEALACGALVVSEPRAELAELFPELPVQAELPALVEEVERVLGDENEYQRRLARCRDQLQPHTYQSRLTRVMNTCFNPSPTALTTPVPPPSQSSATVESDLGDLRDWRPSGRAAIAEAGNVIRLSKPVDDTPGAEQGLGSRESYSDVELSFELKLRADCRFIAKVHHVDPNNHLSNSYHLYFHCGRAYFARHHRILSELKLTPEQWHAIKLTWQRGTVSVSTDNRVACQIRDSELPRGFAFVGVKGGEALMRNLHVRGLPPEHSAGTASVKGGHQLIYERGDGASPRVSVISTVYDRVECLRQCLRSVNRLSFRDLEHIVVSDAPSPPIVAAIEEAVKTSAVSRLRYVNLAERANDWGIKPAAVGLTLASGRYVAFLSDDNGYARDHLEPMVALLDKEPALGFVYSSCLYAGRCVLNYCPPAPGRIDLGQPLFRRGLFDLHLGGTLPFKIPGWDWQMIHHFISRGVQYRHVNRPSFIFRLAQYPQFLNG